MSGGWTEVSAIATGVSALATATAAGFTAWMAKRTREVAEETKKSAAAAAKSASATYDAVKAANREADAALVQAEASQELAAAARTDRELAYQPLLSAEFLRQFGDEYQDIKIVNVGSGPAIDVIYARKHDPPNTGAWFISDILQISANDARELRADGRDSSLYRSHWFNRSGERDADFVLVCRDILGHRHRFLFYGGRSFHEVKRRDEQHPMPGVWWGDPELWPLETVPHPDD